MSLDTLLKKSKNHNTKKNSKKKNEEAVPIKKEKDPNIEENT